ncbi:MAG: hypothetical protein PHP25_02350 [Candidatus Moranbacteria bacterium]|nr:hypothetical protein [Candidatus Moranbacteria bacterium]
MVERIPDFELNTEKIEIVACSKDKGVENCIIVRPGVVPTILEIVRAATENEAVIKGEPERYLIQFPGQGQELLTYAEIFKKLESLPGDKS